MTLASNLNKKARTLILPQARDSAETLTFGVAESVHADVPAIERLPNCLEVGFELGQALAWKRIKRASIVMETVAES